MAIEMTKELKLIVYRLANGRVVPDKLKLKGLEQLNLMLMEYEEGDAMFYVLDTLYRGINELDVELVKEAAEMSVAILGRTEEEHELDPAVGMLTKLSYDAVRRFAVGEDEEMLKAIALKLADNGLLLVYYNDSFAVFCDNNTKSIVCAAINGIYDKDQVLKRFEDMPADIKADIMGAVHKVLDTQSCKVILANLTYDKYSTGQVVVKVENL